MLTGLWPKNHGLRDNAGFRLEEKVLTISEVLQEEGYTTGAFVSAYVLSRSWGLDQGFDKYHDPFHPQDIQSMRAFGELELPAAEVINAMLAWYTAQSKPRFAWLHLYDPHEPWDPHGEGLYSGEGDPYRAEIAKVDRLLSRVLKTLDENTLIIVTSDHGESLWEGGEREHGVLLHRSVTRVPLIIRPPGGIDGEQSKSYPAPKLDVQRPDGIDENLDLTPVAEVITGGKIIEVPASGVDIAATIASFVGRAFPSDGKNLLAAQQDDGKTVYAETLFPYFHYGWQPLKMAQTKDLRLEKGAYERFLDPTTSEARTPNSDLSKVVQALFGDGIPTPGPIGGDVAQALSALGYVTEQVRVPIETAPDPRDKVHVLRQFRAIELLPQKEAIPALRKLIEQEPSLYDAKISLAIRLSAQNELEAALALYIEILEEEPVHSTALNNATIIAHQLKSYSQALGFAHQMKDINPKDSRAYRYLVAIHAEMENPQEVIRYGEEGLLIGASDPNLNYLVGLSYIFVEQPERAEAFLLKAMQYGSRASDINLWQGIAAQRVGDISKAKRYFEQASKDAPQDLRPGAMAGMMLADADRCDEARAFLINVAKRGAVQDPGVQAALQKCNIR